METSAREGEGPLCSRPLQKWNDFLFVIKWSKKNISLFSRSAEGRRWSRRKHWIVLVRGRRRNNKREDGGIHLSEARVLPGTSSQSHLLPPHPPFSSPLHSSTFFFFWELHQVLQEVLSRFDSLTFVHIFHQLVQQYVPRCHVQIKLAVLSKLNKT